MLTPMLAIHVSTCMYVYFYFQYPKVLGPVVQNLQPTLVLTLRVERNVTNTLSFFVGKMWDLLHSHIFLTQITVYLIM